MSAAPGEPPRDILDTPDAGPTAIRGGALRGAGYAAGLLISVAAVPFVIRHLGVVDFGRYVVVTALITLVAGLTEGGLQAVGTREFTLRDAADRHRLMRNLLGVRIGLTGLGVALAVGFALVAGYDRTLVLGTAVAGLAMLVQSLQTLLAVPLVSHLRLGWATVADLLRQSVFAALTIGMVALGASLLPFFAVAVPASGVAALLTAWLVRRLTPFRPAFDPAEWWLLVRDTIPYAAAIAVNIAYFRLAIVIMSLLATELETGYFGASFRVLEVLLPIPALAVGAVFPILARAGRDDIERLAYVSQRIFDVALIAGAGMVLLLEVGAPLILQVLAGEAGRPSVIVLRLQAPALLATFIAVGCGFSLLSLRRHRAMLLANLVALVFSVVLTVALVPGLGARGAAVATTSAEWALALAAAILLVRTHRRLRLSLRVAAPVSLATALGATSLALPVSVAVQTVAAGAMYLAVLLLLRSVPPEVADAWRVRRGAA